MKNASAAPDSASPGIPAFLGKCAPWFFTGVAAVIVMTRMIPANVIALIDSDNIQMPLLWRDLFVDGHHLRDWNWGGHSDFFPDVVIGFVVNPLTGGGLPALQAWGCVMFALLMLALVTLHRQNGGRNAAAFTAGLLLFVVGVINNFGIHVGAAFGQIFINDAHGGTQVMTLFCVALAQRAGLGEGRWPFRLLCAICMLTAASDLIFPTIFTIPFVITLGVARLAYPGRIRHFVPLVCGILGSSAMGVLAGSRLFPVQTAAGNYLKFTAARVVSTLSALRETCRPSMGGDFVVLLGLDAVCVLCVAWLVAASLRKTPAKRMPPMLFILLAFGALTILCNWGTVLVTGNYEGVNSARDMRLSLLLPPLFALSYAVSLIPSRGNAARVTCIALSLAASAGGFFLPPDPHGSYYAEEQQLLPVLRATMREENISSGLANYRYANLTTFLSGDTVKLRSINGNGSFYFWICNMAWFTGGGASEPPGFRMIYMKNIRPEKIRQRYGEPSRIIPTPLHEDIWVYPPDRKIMYNPVCRDLTNDPACAIPGQYSSPASALPSRTGRPDGSAIVAVEGRDRADYLTYGHYFRPAPGSYRVTITYSYTAQPAPDKLVHCDLMLWGAKDAVTLAEGDLPFIDTARHEFTRDIAISNPDGEAIEARTFYRGSGGVRIEALRVTCLRPDE